MQRTVRDVLINALEELERDRLKRFKGKLTDVDIEEDYSKIPRGRLENAEVDKIVDIIWDFYGDSYGCKLTLDVLYCINERQVENNLRKDLDKIQRPTFAKLLSVQNNVKMLLYQVIYLLLSSGNTYLNLRVHFSSQHPKTKKGIIHLNAGKECKEEKTTQTDLVCWKECKEEQTTQTDLVCCEEKSTQTDQEPHTLAIQKGKLNTQSNYQNRIEENITDLLKRCREKKKKLNDKELKREFEEMWERTLTDLQIEELKTHNVSRSMFQQLMNDMSNKGSAVNERLLSVKDLADITQTDFKMDEKYIEKRWYKKLTDKLIYGNEHFDKINGFARSLIDNCNKYIREKVETGEDYCDNYCQELLHMITTEISKQSRNLHLSSWFEVDIKLHILRKASREFQRMHEKFIIENDPKVHLEKLKPGYLETFISIFQEKDISQTKAKEFCERCLKPAMMDHVFHHLGQKIVDDIEGSPDNKTFRSRTFFQEFLMKELLKEMSFQKYVDYMLYYEKYTKAWILNYIETYTKPQILKPLQENLLSSLDKKINGALIEDNSVKRSTVSDFLKSVCEILKEELVIPQNEMQAVTFQNTADVGQFSSDIQLFLRDTETEVLSELQSMDIKSVLSRVRVKPQDELFRKVVGCGKQCPFCGVPCEAGGDEHKEHFATIHRPKGLGRYKWSTTPILPTDICSTSVVSDRTFQNSDTEYKSHPYREYRAIYPDWSIQPDPSIESSDYWKYIFMKFNEEFAKEYKTRPAEIPDGWKSITEEKALQSLKKIF